MKLAITSSGPSISAAVDPRFGRCAYVLIVDPDSMRFQVVENHQNLDLPQGAGIQAGKTIVNHRADVLITGHCGPKAFSVLKRAGVAVITGASGTVEQVIEQYKSGGFNTASRANVDGH